MNICHVHMIIFIEKRIYTAKIICEHKHTHAHTHKHSPLSLMPVHTSVHAEHHQQHHLSKYRNLEQKTHFTHLWVNMIHRPN